MHSVLSPLVAIVLLLGYGLCALQPRRRRNGQVALFALACFIGALVFYAAVRRSVPPSDDAVGDASREETPLTTQSHLPPVPTETLDVLRVRVRECEAEVARLRSQNLTMEHPQMSKAINRLMDARERYRRRAVSEGVSEATPVPDVLPPQDGWDDARACTSLPFQSDQDACILRALEGRTATERSLRRYADTLRVTGRRAESLAAMRQYVQRYPTGPEATRYLRTIAASSE